MLAEKTKQNESLHKQLEASAAKETALLETLNSNLKPLEHHSGKNVEQAEIILSFLKDEPKPHLI